MKDPTQPKNAISVANKALRSLALTDVVREVLPSGRLGWWLLRIDRDTGPYIVGFPVGSATD